MFIFLDYVSYILKVRIISVLEGFNSFNIQDIRALFPSDCNPFYAGFGNRDTDEISYLKVGIPRGKIFIINPKVGKNLMREMYRNLDSKILMSFKGFFPDALCLQGEVAVHRRVDTKSYTSLHALVNGMFPAMTTSEQVLLCILSFACDLLQSHCCCAYQ